jgi:bacterioferritin (cytochrome b1)
MGKIKKLSLGLEDKDRTDSVAKLDELFCTLSLALDINLKLYWMTSGGRIGDLYRKKLDMTWSQVNRLGMRIIQLGANPTMNPIQQQKKSWVSYRGGETDLALLVSDDLQGENEICVRTREKLRSLQSGPDWSSFSLLGEILVEREDIFYQQESSFEYEPVLEHIWEDEEMRMKRPQKPPNPMH